MPDPVSAEERLARLSKLAADILEADTGTRPPENWIAISALLRIVRHAQKAKRREALREIAAIDQEMDLLD